MTTHAQHQKSYINRLRSILKMVWGNRCQICGKSEEDRNINRLARFHRIKEKRYTLPDLEFAHLGKTGVSGMGRGSTSRFGDVAKNIDKYTLLCHNCHARFDTDPSFRSEYYPRLKQTSEHNQWYYIILRLIHKEVNR